MPSQRSDGQATVRSSETMNAGDRPIAHLLYVLALFRKLVRGIAQATVGHLSDAPLRARLKKLGWPLPLPLSAN